MWSSYCWNGFGWWWGSLFTFLFWVLIICCLVILIKHRSEPQGPKNDAKEAPLDILKRRYASGEINSQEFAQMKKDLGY
ncbi:MAG: SHOCT domain-containing protein [Candidatus Omnitrophica bacterium]|nr:SHOCT domain-containing protein [Candidatus Omnitrophota bacterium]MDE2008952.1 SHOCT domain-containing protein [Candidatus Omnitrophota bacterium]MDE2213485.1 SHOCT domain-containing protein [Candidatus Omnitrophota bacterium]MDE2230614.1 SHOCT domain-containing protein [Candidatus Omnitrophota bacterium]